MQKMNSQDQAFLEKFHVKQLISLIGRENFRATEFSIIIQTSNFYILSLKVLVSPTFTGNKTLWSKNLKKSLKF